MTEVDLFISTKRIKVLMADSQVQGSDPVSGAWGRSMEASAVCPGLISPTSRRP